MQGLHSLHAIHITDLNNLLYRSIPYHTTLYVTSLFAIPYGIIRQSFVLCYTVLSLVLVMAVASVAGLLNEFLNPGYCDIHSDLSDDMLISENLMNGATACAFACQENSDCR